MVSVIMPLYNAEKFLPETIESVLNQSYRDWELIIVDDVSTDNSFEIAKRYSLLDSRIKVLQLSENSGGPARPRNTGIREANGEYIAFLDADDVWESDKLSSQLEFLKDREKAFTSCRASQIDKNGRLIEGMKRVFSFWKGRKSKRSLEDLMRNNFIITSSVLIEKKYLGRFDESKDMVAVEDLCMWLNIFHRHPGIYEYQNKTLLKYRILDDSISQRNIADRHDTRMLLCLMRFLLEKNMTHLLKDLKWSICKSRIAQWFKK